MNIIKNFCKWCELSYFTLFTFKLKIGRNFIKYLLALVLALGATSTFAAVDPSKLEADCRNGDSDQCWDLAWAYHDGEGVAQDQTKSLQLFNNGCKQGDMDSCFQAAYQYEQGEGTQKDFSKAIKLYKLACKKGDGDSCNNLGIMYENGAGVPEDFEKAAEKYKTLANLEML